MATNFRVRVRVSVRFRNIFVVQLTVAFFICRPIVCHLVNWRVAQMTVGPL